jgi:hypothetical protein
VASSLEFRTAERMNSVHKLIIIRNLMMLHIRVAGTSGQDNVLPVVGLMMPFVDRLALHFPQVPCFAYRRH